MKPEKKNRNKTGLPDSLKFGIENLSGQSMNDVKIHYCSDKPDQLLANAYAQGTDIHLSAGQEKHLPHEAWHVIQQNQAQDKTTLQGLSKISLYNSSGRLDENFLFQLFGPLPIKGSYLLIGSSEWLNKRITEITIKIFWEKGIPSDFGSYYSAYSLDYKNASFKVDISVLKDGVWKSLNDKYFSLFEENIDNIISPTSTFSLNFENSLVFAGSEEKNSPLVYNSKTREGFIKMELVMPIDGFGQALYASIFAPAAIEQAGWSKRNPFWEYLKFWEKKRTPQSIPSLPYSPLVDKIEISIAHLNPS